MTSDKAAKSPRFYAFDILKLETKKERNDYLNERVPKHLRGLVKSHVKAIWFKK